MLDIIENLLRWEGKKLLRLDGHTPQEHREPMCKRFNNNSEGYHAFLISSKAGGMGLNLTGATRVIHFDVNWNPTVDQQAQDRAYVSLSLSLSYLSVCVSVPVCFLQCVSSHRN